MSKRFECEHNWIIDNNKRKTKESLIVYDEEWNTLDDLCDLLNQQAQRIAELEEQLKKAVVLKPDRYVIVSNGWKKRVWGIAKIQQEVCDNFIYCSDNYIGCYSPFYQYGEFATKEEAEAKLKEIKGENK